MSVQQIQEEFRGFPKHWKVVPFLEALSDETGGNAKVKTKDYLDSGVLPVIDQGETKIAGYVEDESLRCKAKLPCILFGDHTRIFKFVDEPFVLGADGVKVLEPVSELYPKFAFYYLRNIRLPQNAGYSRHFKFLKRTFVPLPPLPEQRRIAAILDKADAIRRKRQEAIKLTEEFLRSVFLDMFGDPVTNPKGWKVVPLSSICTTQLGKMLSPKAKVGQNPIPYLRNASVQWRWFDLKSLPEMDFSNKEKQKLDLRDGDLLVCEGGEVGRCAIWRGQLETCSFQKALHRVRTDQKKTTSEYLQEYFFWMARLSGLSDSTSQATIAHLTGVKLKQLSIPLPPIEMQKSFSRFYSAFEKMKTHVENRFVELEMLFKRISSDAFEGKLRNGGRRYINNSKA